MFLPDVFPPTCTYTHVQCMCSPNMKTPFLGHNTLTISALDHIWIQGQCYSHTTSHNISAVYNKHTEGKDWCKTFPTTVQMQLPFWMIIAGGSNLLESIREVTLVQGTSNTTCRYTCWGDTYSGGTRITATPQKYI